MCVSTSFLRPNTRLIFLESPGSNTFEIQDIPAVTAEARRRGLNPNQWFFQVERVAMEQLGMGVVSYVNAVNKYYLAYDRERFLLEPQKRKLSAKK